MSATTEAVPRVCRGCGCTDEDGCLVQAGLLESFGWVGCSWWEDDLCTGCVDPLYQRQGPREDHRATDRMAILERVASESRSLLRLRDLFKSVTIEDRIVAGELRLRDFLTQLDRAPTQ